MPITIGGMGSGGSSLSLPDDLIFANTTARDDFFTVNPSRLRNGVYVSVAGQLQKYVVDTFQDASAVIKGPSGQDAPAVLFQYSANGTSGWSETLNTSIHKYWRWSSDGGNTWSADGVRFNATSTASGVPEPYSYEVGGNGKLQLFKSGLMIAEQDEEGTWLANSVSTGTGSLHIGELHNNGSGGEQVVWVNEDSSIAYYPAWGGVSLDGVQHFDTAARTHGPLQVVLPNGATHSLGVIDYNYQFTCPSNLTFYHVDLVPAETFQGRLRWKVEKSTGREVAAFYFEANFTQGVPARIPFNYPLWATTDQRFQLTLSKDDGSFLQVHVGDDGVTPWRKNYYSEYTDNIVYHEGNLSSLAQGISGLTGSDRISASAIRDFPSASPTNAGVIKVGPSLTINGDGVLDSDVAAAEKRVAAGEAAMLALPQISNLYIVTRTDIDKLFYLNADDDPSLIGNWEEGASVGDVVASFNGRSGAVTPQAGDYNQRQIKTIHDDTSAEGYFGIDNTGIYFEDGL